MENIEKNDVSSVQSNNLVEPAEQSSKINAIDSKRQANLDYLLKQAELYTHFVTNGSKLKNNKRKSITTSTNPVKRLRRKNETESKSEDLNTSSVKVKVQFDQTPSYIVGEMRDYQIRALNWLITLYENGINGILADEMGLGKTLQTISMLGYLKQYEKVNGPHLIVAPNSTLQNWLNEINKFCPLLNGLILIGDKSARSSTLRHMKEENWDVCITSYEMCLLEKGPLKRFNWKYVVVDEAHRIKNEKSKLSKVLRTFNTGNRLLLTGTPLQNNLHELWSLLNYLLPSVFTDSDDFDTWFDSDNCLRGNVDIIKRLHTILRPFMLRRIKSEVEKSLLPKIELKLFVGLTTIQRETYKKVLMKDVQTVSALGQASQKAINNVLMELRKVANHPYLIDGIEPGPPYTTDMHLVNSCGKMMVLDKLLVKLKAQGSRVVLFSQFVLMLNVLEDYLMWRGYKYCRLDGNNTYDERAKSIDEFNAENSEKFVFILSTRAGGLGINLTTADTVIIYDSDWNPQSDFQAIDRVHRIGQKKQVRVFRLITENTVDERIVQRAGIKQRLDQMIIQQGRQMDKETVAEQKGMKRDMIRFGAKYIMESESSDIFDVDIEKILKDGELKTAEEDEKLTKMNENGLRSLTMDEASSVSVYQFEGIDFRAIQESTKSKEFPNGDRPQRAAKRNRKVYEVEAQDINGNNLTKIHMHQFYPKMLYELTEDGENLDMSYDAERKNSLLDKGFRDWSEDDYEKFRRALCRFGRDDLLQVAKLIPGKTLADVTKYNEIFWLRGRQFIEDFHEIVKKIKKTERLIAAQKLEPAPLPSSSTTTDYLNEKQQSTQTNQFAKKINTPAWLGTCKSPSQVPIKTENLPVKTENAPIRTIFRKVESLAPNSKNTSEILQKWIISDTKTKKTPSSLMTMKTEAIVKPVEAAIPLIHESPKAQKSALIPIKTSPSPEKCTFSKLMDKFDQLDSSLNEALGGLDVSFNELNSADAAIK